MPLYEDEEYPLLMTFNNSQISIAFVNNFDFTGLWLEKALSLIDFT
jgi:hypothetical protein